MLGMNPFAAIVKKSAKRRLGLCELNFGVWHARSQRETRKHSTPDSHEESQKGLFCSEYKPRNHESTTLILV